MKVDRTIDKYKARPFVKGFRKKGLDFFNKYSPAIRITFILMLLQ